jgi:hypothetical protein
MEAWLYYYRMTSYDVLNKNHHPLFTFERSCFWAIVLIVDCGMIMDLGIYCFLITAPSFLLSLMCSFPIMHDGAYFNKRNELQKNLYTNGFKAKSDTSDAKIELTYSKRLLLSLIGIIFLITALITPYFFK